MIRHLHCISVLVAIRVSQNQHIVVFDKMIGDSRVVNVNLKFNI